jgi:hypothetical protein
MVRSPTSPFRFSEWCWWIRPRAATRSRQHRCRALRRSLSPTFRLEFLSLGAGAAKQLLDLRGPPDGEVAAGADADFSLAISVCCGVRAGGAMVPARCELRGRIGDDPIATAPL